MKPRGFCGWLGCRCCGGQNQRPRSTDERAALRDQEDDIGAMKARLQARIDAMPRQTTSPGASDWLAAELAEWAPLRASATRAILGEEADVD